MSELETPPAWMWRGYNGLARGLHRLGERRYRLADALGNVAWAVQPPRRRRLCAAQHRRAAPQIDEREARRRARRSYCEYTRMIIDTVWVHAVSTEEMLSITTVDNVATLERHRDEHAGSIICLAHFGTWDIAASVALALRLRLTTVMAPVGPAWVTNLIAWSRSSKTLELFKPRQASRGLLRALEDGRFVALLVDIPHGGQTAIVDFCNGPVGFSTGPAWLARRTGVPLLPADCWREAGGRFRVRIHEPISVEGRSDDEVMQEIARQLDVAIAQRPEQWYPFNPVYADAERTSALGDHRDPAVIG